MGYAKTYEQVYWLRALMGVSEALYLPTDAHDCRSDVNRSLAIGIHMSGLYTGQALGGFGATIAANFSWQAVFHLFGIIGIIYAVVLIFLLHDKEGHAGTKTASLQPAASRSTKEPFVKSFGVIFGMLSFWILLFYFMAPGFPTDGLPNGCLPILRKSGC